MVAGLEIHKGNCCHASLLHWCPSISFSKAIFSINFHFKGMKGCHFHKTDKYPFLTKTAVPLSQRISNRGFNYNIGKLLFPKRDKPIFGMNINTSNKKIIFLGTHVLNIESLSYRFHVQEHLRKKHENDTLQPKFPYSSDNCFHRNELRKQRGILKVFCSYDINERYSSGILSETGEGHGV
jgi:hypothetical protein